MSLWDDGFEWEAEEARTLEQISAGIEDEHPELTPQARSGIARKIYEDGAFSVEPDFDVSDGETWCCGTAVEVDERALAVAVEDYRRKWLRYIKARAIRPARRVRVRTARGRRVTAAASRSAGGGSSGRPRPSDEDPAAVRAAVTGGGLR